MSMTPPDDVLAAGQKSLATPGAAPRSLFWIFCLLLAATLAAYWPAIQGGFLWDDAGHITHYSLESWSGLFRIWFEPGVTQQYYPLLHSAFWFEHHLWGDATLGYHLVNVLWHASSACLLIAILRRLSVRAAVLAGFVFALHPVAVESVAWICEQKNTLSTLIYLAAALAWFRYEDKRGWLRYGFFVFLFLAALASKSVTATLPAALLVLCWWRRGRLTWRGEWLLLLPLLCLGVIAGLGTAWLEATQIGASGADFKLSFLERGLLAGRVLWYYFGKIVWPSDLCFFYPRWTIDGSLLWQWLFPAAVLLLLTVFFWWRRRSRGPLAAALLYGGTLFPVLGFVNVYPFIFSYVADHFQYLASLGLISFLVACVAQTFSAWACPRWLWASLCLVVLVLLGSLTWRQSGLYRDSLTLYDGTLRRNPDSWVAHLNLGTTLDEQGRSSEGVQHIQRSLELKPDHPDTLNSLGNVLCHVGRASEALPYLDRAVHLQPRFAEAHNTRGAALMALGRAKEGLAAFQRAVELKPSLVSARMNFGWALANDGRANDAIPQFAEACRLHADFAEGQFKWGMTLAMSGHTQEALCHLENAVELSPENADMHFALASVLLNLGQTEDALTEFQETLRLAPSHAGARRALAYLLRSQSR